MIRSFFLLIISLSSLYSSKAIQADIIDDLSSYFKAGNAKEIAKNFASTIELIIVDEEDVYSKAQGEQILRDFFVKHPPVKTSVFHKINNSPNYRFGVVILSTSKETFRVSITMKKFNSSFLITELRIEPAKD
ncbi:DUF4783 domain-containing protein [Agrobacterium tumefaciens]|uniref:Uncharacterized protein DUF4783 n=1 Tax=Pedobacter psychrotolerans TaxID=1843235 RepID=A0A4R2H190_9SPHI|nr:DUF4783 domain-containing protein [Pedobacter psychrotolerans]NTE00456.1 DUF4783 domain-containing protein [Agrobacterium tumefaciens]NTE21449.1 DUF4783 domain-containing protein [Agrobacterium tumefaciens]TCO18240.1 uncharacterized protein DUF4783 [Pedobacter psychrotolerans]GGE70865.1 hypothetical protein GCM10011413_41990 [Pedobacter psychrotolerans]